MRVSKLGKFLLLSGILAITAGPNFASAQTAKVSVDISKDVNVLTATTIGVPAATFDGAAFNPVAAPFTHLAGAGAIIYPGGNGAADLYHWSTNTLTPYKGTDPPYVNPDANFGSFARNLDKFGTALVMVNYGTNVDGTGGGDAGEAAAWVAYANGDPADARPILKDPGGAEWYTVGFWATIRSQAPLQTDDGYNFLRIAHPRPFGITLWQVGDQVYNNGFYGGEHTGEPDLHGPAPMKLKDFRKLEKNTNLSPDFYGARVLAYAKAMKDVDANIKIGATLSLPPDDERAAPGWNAKVLRAACSSIDFVTLDMQMSPLQPPDWKTLDEEQLLHSSRQKVADVLAALLNDYRRDCPKDYEPRIAFAPAAIAAWPRIERPAVTALWVADTYAILAETGAENVSWREMHGDSMLSNDNKSFGPAFMGMEMLHILAHNPGDVFVNANSNSSSVAAHATRRRDGVIGLMLVNEDPKSAATVSVTIAGGSVAPKGRRFDYGIAQQKAGASLAQSEIDDLSGKFAVTVPPYTITDILIPPVK